MVNIESETIEEQYANWHPETSEAEESELRISDEEIALQSKAILEYTEKLEAEESDQDKKRNLARDFYQKIAPIFSEKIKKIAELFESGKNEEAEKLGKQIIHEAKEKSVEFLGDSVDAWYSEYEKSKTDANSEPDVTKHSKLYRLAMEAINFVPVIGSAKLIGEGLSGRTMGGEKLSRTRRAWQATEGAVFLALDLTGIGIEAAEGMKAGRAVTRSAALMRKTGMAREIYSPVYKTGKYLIDNPLAAKFADQSLDKIVQARKYNKNLLVENAKAAWFEAAKEEEPETAKAA